MSNQNSYLDNKVQWLDWEMIGIALNILLTAYTFSAISSTQLMKSFTYLWGGNSILLIWTLIFWVRRMRSHGRQVLSLVYYGVTWINFTLLYITISLGLMQYLNPLRVIEIIFSAIFFILYLFQVIMEVRSQKRNTKT
jgi:hypothetical protein